MKLRSEWKVLALIAVAGLAGCRRDMQDQPRYRPLRPSGFFGDRRSERPLVDGTVARGQLRDDAAFYTGKDNSRLVTDFPFPITAAVLARGRERYDIYCAPCHDRLGNGLGMVVRRGYRRPPPYHIDRLRTAPNGYFFDVMTNGFGAMPDYAQQVAPGDRWAIVAYIRALQRSQNANIKDVAPGAWPQANAGGVTP